MRGTTASRDRGGARALGGRRLRIAAILPLAAVLLWSGLLMAVHRFPAEYDWRYMTVSVLLSAKDNPGARDWAEIGVALCGLAVLVWSFAVGSDDPAAAPAAIRRPRGVYWLRWGGAFMIGSGVLPFHLLGLTKAHEILTLLAFVGLCLGAVRLTLDRAYHASGARSRGGPRRSRILSAALAAALIAPIALAGLAQLYVFYVLPQLHWVGLAWRARGVPVYLSFAFWEWVTFVLLSLYLAVLGVVVRVPTYPRGR